MTHDGTVWSVAFSPDGKFVVSGSEDGTARVWEAATGKETARMTYDRSVYSVAFSPDGKYVVSGGCNQRDSNDNNNCTQGSARVWEAATGKETARMTHDGFVYSAAFSPDGKYVVSGSWDKTARVWETATGKETARMTHDDIVFSVAFSPNGKYVVSGGWDKTARVWMYLPDDLIAEACSRVTRNLTRTEWKQYIGDALSYQAVCPNLPIEAKSTPTATP
jgi:WD40 repeat protein